MRERASFTLVAALIGAVLASPIAAQEVAASRFDEEFETATSTILCDCGCHPQSVKDCTCGRAGEMREEIGTMILRGVDGRHDPASGALAMSGDEVVEHYVAQHGEQIRIAPVARGFNLIAWLGPLVGLLVLSLAMIFLLRAWTRRTAAAPAEQPAGAGEAAPAAPPLDDGYRERLQRELERW